MRHMDGKTPSGFNGSTYRGMNPPAVTPGTTTGTTTTEKVEIKSFLDLCIKAQSEEEFWTLFSENWWVIFVWFHFW